MASLAVALRSALDKLAQMDGFVGAAIISPEGDLLASVNGEGWDMGVTCGLAHNLFAAANRTGTELGWGGVTQLDIATSSGSTVFLRYHKTSNIDVVVLLVCKQETSKALVRLRLDQTLPEISAALSL